MSVEKRFTWSEKVYTMKEFVDIFTYRLPQIIFIAVGWDGKDEEHTFSGDEIYRIGAVKRQRRIVAKHGSGYFVSIPTTSNKKIDIFFPGGKVEKSVNMDDLLSALTINDDGSLKMMFENDEKMSFSFGPDQGAKINFGILKVIAVYEERYLVGHSVCDGKVYSPGLPVSIPVYMTIELSTAAGLDGGTNEDYYKVLADIEEQMRVGKTEVTDNDEIMLFPHDITGADYEYVRPCDWVPGILCGTSCTTELPKMTLSPAYPTLLNRPPPRAPTLKVPHRIHTNKSLPPDPPAAHDPVEGRPHAVVVPVLREEVRVVPQQTSAADTGVQLSLPRRAPRMSGANPVTTASPRPRPTYNVISSQTAQPDTGANTSHKDPLYYDLTKYISGTESNVSGFSEYKTLSDVPADIRILTSKQLACCMRMLMVPEPCICAFLERNVDGYMLMSIDETILTDEFKFSRFDAIKAMKFAKNQYRP